MATIIPGVSKKTSLLQVLLVFFPVALLIAIVSSYFVFSGLENRAWGEIESLEKEIKEVGHNKERSEKEVLAAKEKIADFLILVNEPRKASNFFEALEEIIHPQVQFNRLSLDLLLFRASLEGLAEDFVALGQQIYILQEQDFIKEISINKIDSEEEKGVSFSLELFLFPEFFK